ncbi:hypothetical protein L6E12_27785 [Actinokineospora sp. PR83]|uniref:hypothetical protein n=1 Tax=Actinokineospora sp. PR83 TaxID=2884908 RepID=UPI001F18DF87|nr:hypothetical protein [Actinokineospora sp. PR83]MCG8919581.1 hypothetical protein [Actinokineospora sp. PR83]
MSEFTESDIRAALDRAVAGEPPFTLDRAAVFAEGRRRVRRRRTAAYGFAAVTAIAVIGTSTLAAGALSTSPQPMPPAAPTAPATTTKPTKPTFPASTPPSTSTTTHSAAPATTSADRNSAAMRDASIAWPVEILRKEGAHGEWYRFDATGTLSARLITKTGDRRLIVQLRGPEGVPPATECPPATRSSLVCSRYDHPDGTVLRVLEDHAASSIVVTSLRPDDTYVTVQETASGILPSRLARVLETHTVVDLALVEGLSATGG